MSAPSRSTIFAIEDNRRPNSSPLLVSTSKVRSPSATRSAASAAVRIGVTMVRAANWLMTMAVAANSTTPTASQTIRRRDSAFCSVKVAARFSRSSATIWFDSCSMRSSESTMERLISSAALSSFDRALPMTCIKAGRVSASNVLSCSTSGLPTRVVCSVWIFSSISARALMALREAVRIRAGSVSAMSWACARIISMRNERLSAANSARACEADSALCKAAFC